MGQSGEGRARQRSGLAERAASVKRRRQILIASVVESLFNFASCSRQEKMEREAEKFQRKADLRSHWLADKKALLDNIAFDEDVEQIQKATKMVDSVDADIGSKVGCLFTFRKQ